MIRFSGARFPLFESIALVVALAAIVVMTLLQHARDEPNTKPYSSYDGSPAGMLGWYELLGAEGIAVGRFEERLPFLDHGTGVLVIADAPLELATVSGFAQGDVASLATWVRSGGHLLLAGDSVFATLAAKDLQLRPAPARLAATTRSPFVATALRRYAVRGVSPAGDARLTARTRDRVLLRDRRGALVLSYTLGRGSVVQLADASMLQNAAIGRPDNARLAYALIALLGGVHARVAFDEALHGFLVPEHWWQILPRPFVVAVLFAALVLAVALAGAALRLGPPRDAERARAPNTEEYLDALATLMERGHAAGASVQRAFASTRRKLARRLDATEASAPELAARIERTDLRDAFVELEALAAQPSVSNDALVRGLTLAHRLREEYGIDVRGR